MIVISWTTFSNETFYWKIMTFDYDLLSFVAQSLITNELRYEHSCFYTVKVL